MADPQDLDALASAIADGTALDWDTIEAGLNDPRRRAVLRNLRALAEIASVHRAESDEASAPPERWSHLELRDRVGGGSFGDVYRAWDPNLEREVALKLVHRGPANGGRGTGLGEARLLARVRHPNVVTVHGADEADGRVGLWMEFVAGRTLRQIVEEQGVFGPQEATITGVALCRALGAIHAAGLLHGDIKAQNVMRERGGRIVLMDLGAARLLTGATTAPQATGTPLYLAPEVLAGGGADPRSDVYSLGVVLFFILTGSFPYAGPTAADIRAAQASGAGRSIRELRADLPDMLVSVIERCLAMQPDARFDSAASLQRALAACLGAQLLGEPAAGRQRSRVLILASAIAMVAVAGSAGWLLRQATTTPPRVQRLRTILSVTPPQAPDYFPAVAISPRGTYVAYRGEDRLLHVRHIDEMQGRPVLLSDANVQPPFFSPDEKWMGYFAHGMLRKYSLLDGATTELTATANPRGATWTEDDWIVYSPTMYEGLWRIRASGGTPERLTTPRKGEASHRYPAALPGGAIAVTVWPAVEDVLQSWVSIYVPSTGAWHRVTRGSSPQYAGGGQLLLAHNGQLVATSYDPAAPERRSALVPVQTDVLTDERSGLTFYGVSDTHLLFVPGWLDSEKRRLTWVGLDGQATPLPLPPHGYERPRIAPDGQQLAFTGRARRADIWHYDLRRAVLRRLTFGTAAEHESPAWSPDGSRLAYTEWTPGSPRSVVLRAPDDTGSPEVVAILQAHAHVSDWPSPDRLVLSQFDDAGRSNIVFTSPARDGTPARVFLSSPYDERDGRISPDGTWVLYSSDESGRDEVYARERNGSRKLQISSGGGSEGVWHPKGGAIFYRGLESMMMVRWPIAGGDAPVRLFPDRYARLGRREINYDITPDGSRLLMVEQLPFAPRNLHLVVGWREEVRARGGG